MDALKVYELFIKNWEHLGFELTKESTSEEAVFETDMEARDYFTDQVHVRGYAFSDSTVHMIFIFDQIKRSEKVYELINELNAQSSWFKGYITKINDNDFFEVHYSFFDAKDEENMVTHLNQAMKDLLSDFILGKLTEICKYTY